MEKSLTFHGILVLIAVFSMIIVPAAFSVNQKTFGSHVPNHTDCRNWENRLDTDCDGIADWWENLGYYEKNGIRVDLPDGVYYKHRDVLVEIDYFTHHEPYVSSLERVKAKFSAMTGLDNPDGSTGVNLHYIKSDNIQHPSGSNPCINIWNDADTNPDNDFNSIKKKWMGSALERQQNPNFYDAAKDVYHYFLFIHTRCGTPEQQQSAGGAEGPGNDGYVSLGYPGWGNVINTHDTGSGDYKARAFAHELGHNLGLMHGGSADYPHCKPNYISVMNYLFEFPIKVPSAAADFDYSKNVIPELNEQALVEANGIGPSWPNGLPTGVGHTNQGLSHSGFGHVREAAANNIKINYNWYTGDTNYNQILNSSITNFHFNPCNDDDVSNSGYNGRLWGFNDIHYGSLIFWALTGATQNSTGLPDAQPSIPFTNIVNKTISSPDKLLASGSDNVVNQTDFSTSNTTSSVSPSNVTNGTTINSPNLGSASYLQELTNLSNDSVSEIVSVPCDRTGDPHCNLNRQYSFVQNRNEDYGNTTIPDELTVTNVLDALVSNVYDIDNYTQQLSADKFTDGTNVTKAKKDLKNYLVEASDSISKDIKNPKAGKLEQALKKLSDLRGNFDVYSGNEPSMQNQSHKQYLKVRDEGVINLIDGLSTLLEKKR